MKNKLVAIALLTATLISAAPAAQANDEKNNVKSELKFLGHVNDQPVFQLKLDNSAEQEFTIVIRDENQNVLYRYSSNQDTFNKKFMLNTEEIGDDQLRFEISVGKTKPVVYLVNQYSRRIDEVVVNKLK